MDKESPVHKSPRIYEVPHSLEETPHLVEATPTRNRSTGGGQRFDALHSARPDVTIRANMSAPGDTGPLDPTRSEPTFRGDNGQRRDAYGEC